MDRREGSLAEPFWRVFDLVTLRTSGDGESNRLNDLETRIGDGRALVATGMLTRRAEQD